MSPDSGLAGSGSAQRRLLAPSLEHTLLRADATVREIETLCAEARQYRFHCVCVNGSRVELAYALLQESGVKVTTTVGFPLGAADPDAKRYETEVAIDKGAQEIDVVMNIGLFKDGEDASVLRELRDIVEAADERPVKDIIEACQLTRDQKNTA
jgi:deoxyribose-phosphate aldolase